MTGLMYEGQHDWRSYIHGEHSTCYSEEQEMQYLTDGQMKYIWLPRLNEEQLFNLVNDPMECNDLSGDHDYQEELQIWRKRPINELESRNAGLTDGDKLLSQSGKPSLVSPNYKARLETTHI